MKVKIFSDHTHEGKLYRGPAVIDLPEESARWLIQAQHAERVRVVEAQERQAAALAEGMRGGDAPPPETAE